MGANKGINLIEVSVEATDGQKDYSINEKTLMDLGSFQKKEGLQDVYLRVNLDEELQGENINVLGKYSNALTDNLGKSCLIEHRVDLTENKPIGFKPYSSLYAVRSC